MKAKRLNRLFLSVMLASLCFPLNNLFAQISEGGFPPSFYYRQGLRSAAAVADVPVDFYVADLQEVDNWLAGQGAPMPVSRLIAVDYTFDNSGYWTTLPGGERIWRLHIKAADAYAIALYYKDFYIPEGGRLFIYSADKSHLLGAYTHSTHPSGGLFATEFVAGDELTLEYVASETSGEEPRIEISDIGYGYNAAALRSFCSVTTRAASDSCEVNINCEEGSAWQSEKKGVCAMVQKVGRVNYTCTGTLVNNTAEDFKPMILTARHCAYGSSDATVADSSDMQQWFFYFNREREDCDNSSLANADEKTMVGCTLLAGTKTNGQSDGMLLLLKDTFPEDYDVFYNGWDARGTASSFGVCIHHPNGDYKKISTYNEQMTTYPFRSSEYTGDEDAHWNVIFATTANGHGVTEGGSSGSPLYNEDKLIIGTLTGGSSSCSNPRGLNLFGKLAYHWDKYQTDSTRLDKWLDPLNTGVKTLAGRYRKDLKPSPADFTAVNQGLNVLLTWNAPGGSETPAKYCIYRNNQKIAETEDLRYLDSEPSTGTLTYSVSAVYADGEESAFSTASVLYTEYKTPTGLEAVRLTQYEVKLTWEAPLYEQTLYWGSMDVSYKITVSNNRHPFYFGQKWTDSEIAPLDKKTVTAVKFVPIEGYTYGIYISQGENPYLQKIEERLAYTELNTVALTAPFAIDGSKPLIIGIYVYNVGSDYPAVCDDGPAVDGKGNIYSYDGEEWYRLLNDDGSFDYNFVVAGIVSSIEGEVAESGTKSGVVLSKGLSSADDGVRPRAAQLDLQNAVSLRSSQPAAFPEVKQYKIYRNKSYFRTVDASVLEYTDTNSASNGNIYRISAVYENGVESALSDEAYIKAVDNANDEIDAIGLFPTRFSNSVSLSGYDKIARIDAVSVDGKVCLSKSSPGNTLDTSSLGAGIYYFRIYGGDGEILKVVSGVKINR